MFTLYKDHPEFGYRTTTTVKREKELGPLLKAGWRRIEDAPAAVIAAPIVEAVPEPAPCDAPEPEPVADAPKKRGRPRKADR